MAALDVFRAIGNLVDSDFLAMDVLPILWQFSLGPLLNLAQFQAYMTLIKTLSSRVENEHTRKLQELGASNTTTATSRNDFMSFGSVGGTNGLDSANGSGETDFEALVRGEGGGASNGTDMLGGDPWANAPSSASSSTILPSRQAANRGRASNNASPAFSWSTPPVSPPATNLSAPQGTSRTITPDNTMNSLNSSFPAITPNNPGIGSSSYSQQQARPSMGMGMGMNSMMTPTTITPSISTQGTNLDWSKSAGSSTLSSNPWGSTTSNNTGNLSNFSIAPPPSQAQPSTNPYSSFSIAPPPNRGNSFNMASQPASGNSSFSIAPPPSTGNRMGGMSMNSMAANPNSMASRLQNQNQAQSQQTPSQGWGASGGDSLI